MQTFTFNSDVVMFNVYVLQCFCNVSYTLCGLAVQLISEANLYGLLSQRQQSSLVMYQSQDLT